MTEETKRDDNLRLKNEFAIQHNIVGIETYTGDYGLGVWLEYRVSTPQGSELIKYETTARSLETTGLPVLWVLLDRWTAGIPALEAKSFEDWGLGKGDSDAEDRKEFEYDKACGVALTKLLTPFQLEVIQKMF